jgi:outer membrane receptor for ferrienterochelin and colicins
MKAVKYFFLCWLIISGGTSFSQVNRLIDNYKAITFKVYGACAGQCKPRIETAAKGKAVRSAVWNADTKMLSLVYDSSKTTLEKIQNRIVAVGHDLEDRKAKDAVYNALPDCCLYREIDAAIKEDKTDSMQMKLLVNDTANSEKTGINQPEIAETPGLVRGLVLESSKKGVFIPLSGASIVWLGTSNGTITDSTGVFNIKQTAGDSRLVISYTGYSSDTLTVTETKDLKIILGTDKKLSEVVITSRQHSVYLSALSPIRTQIMTGKELLKAACCNLSESFETNPSVDVSYNDAVTGSRQIQLLGLSGNYTQLTVENLPGPRGIATPLGLNAIAGPWVESIQLTKGIGSVANGYESIAGQINVELKKPENSESFYANAYINDFGKTDLNLNLSKKMGTKWAAGLLLHDDFLANKKLDFNNDGFRDLPTGNQFSLINRWKYEDGSGFLTQFGIKIVNDKRTGGETAFNAGEDKNTTHHYGLSINTARYEAFAKIGYVFPQKKYKSIGLQLSAIAHQQHSYFGLTVYNAKQQNFYSNLIYQSIINNTNYKFRTGISFLYDRYNEDFKANKYERAEIVPGAFFEYTFTYTEKLNIVAGVRADHNNLFGFFVTPRVHVRYEPVEGTTIRLSAGRGQRTANIFAENTSVFVSSRQVSIIGAEPGKAYGLHPEIAWNKGVSVDQKFKLFQRDALVSLDFFRNDFDNQVVVDLENVREVRFYNLRGKSYSNSVQAELNLEPVKKLEVRLAYRYFDVKTTYGGQLLQRPFISGNRAFANLAYSVSGWKFDYTINFNGRKRIPDTQDNPAAYQRDQYAPVFVLMNAQISKTISKKHPMDFYLGAENIGNYYLKNAIVAANEPFSTYFDASLVWGPVTGRMLYAGWRYKLK